MVYSLIWDNFTFLSHTGEEVGWWGYNIKVAVNWVFSWFTAFLFSFLKENLFLGHFSCFYECVVLV